VAARLLRSSVKSREFVSFQYLCRVEVLYGSNNSQLNVIC